LDKDRTKGKLKDRLDRIELDRVFIDKAVEGIKDRIT
jgi:hypothetical protein